MTSLSNPGADRTRRPTMRSVAALAGVGIKTVSRVVNDEPNVAPETAERVRKAIETLGYYADEHAGSLRRASRSSHTIGLLVESVANPFASVMHRAIEDYAAKRGSMIEAMSVDEHPERERDIVAAMLRRRVDGLILMAASPTQTYLSIEQHRGLPLVFVDRLPVGLEADAVVADNAAGGRQAAEHLARAGHQRFAYVGDRPELYTARERRTGFLDGLALAGHAREAVTVIEGLSDTEAAAKAVRELLRSDDPPTAIFSSQNLVTFGAVHALRDADARYSTALVGFDDFALADLLEPAVTVVAQDVAEIGRSAAERLFARIDGDDAPARTTVVPTTLIARGSGEIRPPAA